MKQGIFAENGLPNEFLYKINQNHGFLLKLRFDSRFT